MMLTQQFTPFLDGSFYFLYGKVGANERTIKRNINFESTITMAGINVSYNFNHFLPEDRIIEPYISLGIETFEFLSKTDLVDKYGNTYNYWKDGSIRSIDENATNASEAIRLQRDFSYESDIRNQDLDGFGPYSEHSYAIPLAVGANFNLTDKIAFRIGTEWHYTFTDYIDGVSDKSVGDRKGNKANDSFLFTSFGLSYNIDYGLRSKKNKDIGIDLTDDLMAEDEDGDGVEDFNDDCAHTSLDASVNERGCPLDGDHDDVPDYADEELSTPDSLVANARGIGIQDAEYERMFNVWVDSTGKYAETKEVRDPVLHKSDGTGGRTGSGGKIQGGKHPKQYWVRLQGNKKKATKEQAEVVANIDQARSFVERGMKYVDIGPLRDRKSVV